MAGKVSSGEGGASLEHILKLLKDEKAPALDGVLARDSRLKEIHNELTLVRDFMRSFLAGDFPGDIENSGLITDFLKTLNGLHTELLTQFKCIEKGDFSRKMESQSIFSGALNSMTSQLDISFKAMKEKERDLLFLTENLLNELNIKNSAVDALKKSESQFRYLAAHDTLTGVMNRRSFIERAVREIENAALLGFPCCIIMMDIDHFKEFNDTYGHLAGDEALKQTVKTLGPLLRKNDFMGRYGGEEFVFLCGGADMHMGAAIAERMRVAMEKNVIRLESGDTRITGSFGLVMTESAAKPCGGIGEEYIERLIGNADAAMYRAKKEGRNRVICYNDEGSDGQTLF